MKLRRTAEKYAENVVLIQAAKAAPIHRNIRPYPTRTWCPTLIQTLSEFGQEALSQVPCDIHFFKCCHDHQAESLTCLHVCG